MDVIDESLTTGQLGTAALLLGGLFWVALFGERSRIGIVRVLWEMVTWCGCEDEGPRGMAGDREDAA